MKKILFTFVALCLFASSAMAAERPVARYLFKNGIPVYAGPRVTVGIGPGFVLPRIVVHPKAAE